MKVSKVVARFSSAPNDPAELRRVARSLGSELPQQQVETLREFRAAMARTPITQTPSDDLADVKLDQTSYAVGYVDSMMDVTSEYEAVVLADEDSAELSADVARGIHIAVELFHHLSTSSYTSDSALTAIASGILGDSSTAAAAVELWSQQSHAAGLITQPYGNSQTDAVPQAVPQAIPQAIPRAISMATGSIPAIIPEELRWDGEPVEPVNQRPSILRAMTEPLDPVASDVGPIELDPLLS